MTSANSEIAAARLADARWRRWNSWWIWAPLVSCGFFSWLGFVVAGVRLGERRYWVAASVFGVMIAVGFTLISLDETGEGTMSDIAVLPVFGSMIGASIVAAVWNRDYLIKLANRTAWAGPSPVPPPYVPPPGPAASQFLGVGQDSFYASPPPPPPPPYVPSPPAARYSVPPPERPSLEQDRLDASAPALDINVAPAEELVRRLGISTSLADRVVAARTQHRGFRSLDDLTSAAGLQPHELVQFRDRVTFASWRPRQPPHGGSSSGRVLDF